ncbi:MAG: hypothetical protein HRU20_26495 [Pseudomonadales bacterium]|nr:hypothetical protein [Pseudomonadales bacterium]
MCRSVNNSFIDKGGLSDLNMRVMVEPITCVKKQSQSNELIPSISEETLLDVKGKFVNLPRWMIL